MKTLSLTNSESVPKVKIEGVFGAAAKLDLAPAAVELPVPPSATATSVPPTL